MQVRDLGRGLARPAEPAPLRDGIDGIDVVAIDPSAPFARVLREPLPTRPTTNAPSCSPTQQPLRRPAIPEPPKPRFTAKSDRRSAALAEPMC